MLVVWASFRVQLRLKLNNILAMGGLVIIMLISVHGKLHWNLPTGTEQENLPKNIELRKLNRGKGSRQIARHNLHQKQKEN